jgi:hypothetical protein
VNIGINRRKIQCWELENFLARPRKKGAVHVYGRYGLEFIDDLYRLQNLKNSAHVLVLFESAEVERVLRHMNIFDGFSFTLVPSVIDRDVYEKMFTFFLHSPMSVSYITWISSLILKPNVREFYPTIDGKPVGLEACRRDCPLRLRNCSRGFLFTQIYHPLKGIPKKEELDIFCRIELEFSERISREIEALSQSEMEIFDRTRKSLGIRSQFWIDPYGTYGA